MRALRGALNVGVCGCGLQVREVSEYLQRGPAFIFVFHPALGPLWDVIGQKVRSTILSPINWAAVTVKIRLSCCLIAIS